VARVNTRANGHKLTHTEDKALLEWIHDLDERGYPLRIEDLCEAAKIFLQQRDALGIIRKNRPTNFAKRQPLIKAKFITTRKLLAIILSRLRLSFVSYEIRAKNTAFLIKISIISTKRDIYLLLPRQPR
jgi:Tc5 transposase DNA-binding domain